MLTLKPTSVTQALLSQHPPLPVTARKYFRGMIYADSWQPSRSPTSLAQVSLGPALVTNFTPQTHPYFFP
jgi:hypothetical protein